MLANKMSAALLCMLAMICMVAAAPVAGTEKRACFLVGNETLPAEVAAGIPRLEQAVTCNLNRKTIGNVPDVRSGRVTFTSVDFSKSKQPTLAFALSRFKTASPLASNDLRVFQDELNVYLATEAGIRSEGDSLAIKVPKFFLAFQIARINTAKGVKITNPSDTVQHLLGKVLKNAAGQPQELLDQVTALSKQLS
ncbi:hypothetical protein RI367_000487 [Sorochytrium milnesiophthora]